VLRGFQIEPDGAGSWKYQLLAMQSGKAGGVFNGRYDVTLSGTLDGKPWTMSLPNGMQTLQVKQYARVEGRMAVPASAVVKTAQLKVVDASGAVRASQTTRL